jgi:glycosyltransferase involved in cell wall biosynthesis
MFLWSAAQMRIAYMLTSLGIGGAERQVIALAERMTARGHTVVLLVLRPRRPEQWRTTAEVVHFDMNKSVAGAGLGVAHAHRFLRAFRPDLVHSHTFPANMTARMLHLLGSAPVVVSTIHNIYEGGLRRTILYSLTDGLTLHTTAVSDAVAKRAIRAGAVTPRKCSVVANGIDTAEFAPDSERRSATRADLHAGDDFIWLTAGRIVPAKDYPNLLRAFAQAQTAIPQMQLWIAGEASASDRSRIESLISQHGLTQRVRLLGLRRDMPGLLDAADGFVLASAWEGMPLVIGEAMAMEKEVVATDVGGVRELVGTTATLVPPTSPEDLATAMLNVARTSHEVRLSIGRAARQRVIESFSIEARTDDWEALYNSLIKAH